MAIILNGNELAGVKVDDVIGNTDNPVKNSTLNTFLNNNSSLTTTNKGVVTAINEVVEKKVSRFTVMPSPDASYANGEIFQYIGITTTVAPFYTHGKFYECVEDTTVSPAVYVWRETASGSEVSVSSTGTSSTVVSYITIDGVESKIGGGGDVQAIFDIIYPVGSYHFGATAPSLGTWTEVVGDRALWLKNTASDGTEITQGMPALPEIFIFNSGEHQHDIQTAWSPSSTSGEYDKYAGRTAANWSCKTNNGGSHTHSASYQYSTIYGATTNVQPNAYVMKVWKRTA